MINLQLDFLNQVSESDIFNVIKSHSQNFEVFSINKFLNGINSHNFKIIIYDMDDYEEIISFLNMRFIHSQIKITQNL